MQFREHVRSVMKKIDRFRKRAVWLLLIFGCLGATSSTRAQDVIWAEFQKFGPPEEELPWVLSLGSAPDGAVYAGLLQTPGSIYRSTDQGRSWEAGDLSAPHIETIVSRSDGSLFIAAYGDGILRSDDTGMTWSASTLPTTLVWDVAVRADTVLAATTDGLFASVDGAATWTRLDSVETRSALITRTGNYIAVTDQGAVISVDDGATWQPLMNDAAAGSLFETAEGILLANTSEGIARSSDEGLTWRMVHEDAHVHEFAADDDGTLYASTGSVLRSDDYGASWTSFSEGLTESVEALAVDASGHVYAGTQSGRIFRTVRLSATAQSDSSSYFPLDLSNAWTYFKVMDPPNAPPDTLWGGTFTISGAISVNDTLYYRARHPFSLADTLRADGEGRVFARVQDRDVLLFDFTMEEGDSYTFQASRQPENAYEVTIRRNLTVNVGAGRFENSVELRFDVPGSVDDERIFAFAPGVGIVYAYGIVGDYEELYSAQVRGRTVTSAQRDTPSPVHSLSPSAYPNPFTGSTTIRYDAPGPARVHLAVYDALGREVALLVDGLVGGGVHEETFDGHGLANGTYYVRMATNGQVRSGMVVLIK